MQYGITVPAIGPLSHPRTLVEMAVEAEAAGWDGFFLWDHVLFGPAPAGDPWIALAAIAVSTDRIRLGPMVTALPRRRPWKLARETVTLDHLSGGRLILGVGIGAGPWDWDYLGEESDIRRRGEMLDEGLEILTKAWSGEPFSHSGKHYKVMGDLRDGSAVFLPPPVQVPRIPIWVGGTWPNLRPFRRAARWDGVIPVKAGMELGGMIAPEDLKEIADYTREHRPAGDDRFFDVVASGRTSGVDPEKDAKTISARQEVGATWWLETIDPLSFGWRWEGDWPVEDMRARVRCGPPRV